MVPTELIIGLSALLFSIGLIGAMLRRHVIVVLLSIELMLGAVVLAFAGFNRMWALSAGGGPRLDGQIFALMVVVVAIAQGAVGLGVVISAVRARGSADLDALSIFKW